ncbi:MAG TPA: M14-type cytosolic carboxypeptidase [Lentimicrobium sp.]|nr:M14-type cytosolic carboxypeptidase [Lentimicrobium sp.]
MKHSLKLLNLLLISTLLLSACEKDKDTDDPQVILHETMITDSFESGSIGRTDKISNTEWELSIADDNGNTSLPTSWRSWWYIKADSVVTDSVLKLTISNSGWPFFYNPVYSYDQHEWFRFDDEEVGQNSQNELVIEKRFDHSTVWIAMFYPYTLSDLETFIHNVQGSSFINISTAGSSQQGNPLYVIQITDHDIPVTEKKRILIHARTHPAETPPSFLIEGMISFLLSGSDEANEMLRHYEFHIFPMQNVDGVIAGNYRSTPLSENLEMLWTYNPADPMNLTSQAPVEVTIIHEYAKTLMTDGGPIVSIALNLHASNSEPDIRPFFYPHFGPEEFGYTQQEASLWNKQLHFINSFASNHGFNMIEPVPAEGGSSFAGKTYPESWWWKNFGDQVMAMTMEMTYGRAGYYPRWIEPSDMREIGHALALGIRDYFMLPAGGSMFIRKQAETGKLKYPDLYPPYAEDELKE